MMALNGFGYARAEAEREHSESFASKRHTGLRQTGSSNSGKFYLMGETARAPHRAGINEVRDPAENQAEIVAIRKDLESLRAELKHLTNRVPSIQPEASFNWNRPKEPVANLLRQTARFANECASERLDEAVSLFVCTASNRTDSKPNWDKTDEAVADLLLALSKQASSDREQFRARCNAAHRLRLARRLAQAEKERKAIRRFRTTRWWRLAFP
ncbi:MAG: hypothetical protein ACJ8DY_01050 [Xanthobacteraceae bacterium]